MSVVSRLAACANNHNKRPCPGYVMVPDLFPKCPVGHKWVLSNGNEWYLQRDAAEHTTTSKLSTMRGTMTTTTAPHVGTQESRKFFSRQQATTSRTKNAQYFVILEHLVLPSDTFMGLCLRYKINPNKLRQFNRFSGSNLALVPSKLYIPVTTEQIYKKVKVQDVSTEEYKVTLMLHYVPSLSRKIAAAYLRICNGNVDAAVEEASGDLDWETSHQTLMLDRILSLRDRKQHEEEEARYLQKLQRSSKPNFCIKAFESFLKDHGVILKKANENEMWFEMTHDVFSKRPSVTSLSWADDGNMSDEEDEQYEHLLSKEYGETQSSQRRNRSFAYSLKYDMSSHQLQTTSTTSTRHHQYSQQYGPQHIAEEIKSAAIAVEQKLFEVLAIFQNHGGVPPEKPTSSSMRFREEETVAFFEMSGSGKTKVA